MPQLIRSAKRKKASKAFFSNDKDIVKKCTVKIKRDPGVENKNTKICSEHFTPGDYFPTSNSRHHLKPGAIHSVFSGPLKDFSAMVSLQ